MATAKDAPKKKGSILSYRAKGVFACPPALLGYSNLVTPDKMYDKFQADCHYNDVNWTILEKLFQEQAEALIAPFKALKDEKTDKPLVHEKAELQSIDEWLENKRKAASANLAKDGVTMDYIRYAKHATKKTGKKDEETGEDIVIATPAQIWAGKDHELLDPSKLRMGAGSEVRAVLRAKVYVPATTPRAIVWAPDFVGLMVDKLVSYAKKSSGFKVNLSDVAFNADAQDLHAMLNGEAAHPEEDDEVAF